MHDSTTTEFFKLIKRNLERHLDYNGGPWSANDSLFLDWAILNMEDSYGR